MPFRAQLTESIFKIRSGKEWFAVMKFLLFGTGDYYNRYISWFEPEEIVALLDNSPAKHNTVLNGKKVMAVEEGIRLSYDVIVILSFYVKAMKEQLVREGVAEQRICHFFDLHDLLPARTRRPVFCYDKFSKKKEDVIYHGGCGRLDCGMSDVRHKHRFIYPHSCPAGTPYDKDSKNKAGQKVKEILLLSQELTPGGPPVALLHAAEILKKHSYHVTVASMKHWPMRDRFTGNGIRVVIDENLQTGVMNEADWIQDYDMLLCNTMNFHIFLSERNRDIPVIWWLHDAPFFYDGIRKEHMECIPLENLYPVSVGPVPEKAIQRFLPGLGVRELLYGVSDYHGSHGMFIRDGKIRLAVIGYLEDIKGQDILLEAFCRLPVSVRQKMELWIVGYNQTLFGAGLKETYGGMEEVRFTGSISRQAVHELLERTDLLVCPSRQDSMPTVAAEAMMHSVACLVSDATGTAALIHHGEDGFIFPDGHTAELADLLAWCGGHPQELAQMGLKAREIYLAKFSMEKFEHNLTGLVRDVLEQNET